MAEVQKVVNLGMPSVDLQVRNNFEALTDQGTMRAVISKLAVLDFGSIAANISIDLTIAVPGARDFDPVVVAPPPSPDAEITFTAFVSAVDVVTVRAANNSAGAVDPASGVYRVIVFNFEQ